MSIDALGLELQKVIALGMDGHSGVDGYQLPGSRYLPFLLEPDGERVVALATDRAAFLANGFPYLTHIDGKEIGTWCDAAAVIVVRGSAQYRRHRCLDVVANLDFVRGLLELTQRDTVTVTLASSDGTDLRVLALPTAPVRPKRSRWPGQESRLLEGNIGYLRLATMGRSASLQEIRDWMPRFRTTAGLIIDVRDNAGGDRHALQLIHSYLAAPGNPPRVFTAAAYRLHPKRPDDYLAENHRMYRADAVEWSESELRAVRQFAEGFTPEWKPPPGQFSDWHFMALNRLNEPDLFHYDRPVIVLMNGRSFSATDIFLAGLKGMKGVTLLGTPSAGGSAYTQEVALGATPLRLRIGSMVSFQADGRLFDGHGVQPDVLVEPTPEYYIGRGDNALKAAMKRLRED
jgi:hypothetical protein